MTLTEFLKKWSPQITLKQQQAFISDAAEMLKPPESMIWIETTISHRDMRPIVTVRMGGFSFQVDPDSARKIGRDFYEAAGGAEADSFLFQSLTGEMKLSSEVA